MTGDATELRSGWSLAAEDHLSPSGAVQLAAEVKYYWRQRGHDVSTRIEILHTSSGKQVATVRSNLVDGLPRDFDRKLIGTILRDMADRWPRPKKARVSP